MGLFDSIKKIIIADEPKESADKIREKSEYGQPLGNKNVAIEIKSSNPTQSNNSHLEIPLEPSNRINTKELAVNQASRLVPPDVLRLLWFKDGHLKNMDDLNEGNVFRYAAFTITVSFTGSIEPSAISQNDEIRPPIDASKLDRPPYYPTYGGLLPEQRWIYLNWLNDLDGEINIGYVFIFYYGLERHLLFGEYESAFNMVLRLRKVHKNKSFMSYSSNALIATCMFRNRYDLFIKYLDSMDDFTDEDVNSMYLLAKHFLGMGLSATEIMLLSQEVGFTNRRYMKEEWNGFKLELEQLLMKSSGKITLDLKSFSLENCPIRPVLITANFSIDQQKRTIHIPDLCQNLSFREEVNRLLKETHETVKVKLKEMRKTDGDSKFKLDGSPAEPKNMMPCPYCGESVEVKNSSKKVCPSCKRTAYLRTDPELKKKVLLDEDGLKRLETRKDQLHIIHLGAQYFGHLGIGKEQIEEEYAKLVAKKKDMTYNEAIWALANAKVLERAGELNDLKMLFYSMALFQESEGKDATQYIRLSHEMELKQYKKHGVSQVKILARGACKGCSPSDGKIVSIDEAMSSSPLPNPNCSHHFHEQHPPFCRCIYLPVIESFDR